MPKLVTFETRDVHVMLDLSLEELNMLADALDNSEVGICRTERDRKAKEYLQNSFFPYINELTERFKNEVQGKAE